jgi:hypothetical protein
VFSFTIPLMAVVFSILGLKQLKTSGETGRNYAIAGLIISGVHMVAAAAVGAVMMLGMLLGAGHHHMGCVTGGYEPQPMPYYSGTGYATPAYDGSYDLSRTSIITSGAVSMPAESVMGAPMGVATDVALPGTMGMPVSPAQG